MGELLGYAIAFGMLMLSVTFGFGVAGLEGNQATITRITDAAAAVMTVEGGYTSDVNSLIGADLTSARLNPSFARVTYTPNSCSPYGDLMTITIVYYVPVKVVFFNPAFVIPVGDQTTAVSLWPHASSSNETCGGSGVVPSSYNTSQTTVFGTYTAP
ncbi:MAG: hypothetical protein ACYCRD_04890 [Leptospirillum sp.]